MINIFFGEDRAAALDAAHKFLGKNYEVIEGENLEPSDLPSIFLGASLFDAERHILIKDILANKNKSTLESLTNYLDTPHIIVLVENQLDKRTSLYKTLAKSATIKEFKNATNFNRGLAFDVYDTALRDGARAVKMVDELAKTSSAPEVIGAWTWKAAQNYKNSPRAREQKALQSLAKIDLQTKSSSTDAWLLLKAFLLTLSQL